MTTSKSQLLHLKSDDTTKVYREKCERILIKLLHTLIKLINVLDKHWLPPPPILSKERGSWHGILASWPVSVLSMEMSEGGRLPFYRNHAYGSPEVLLFPVHSHFNYYYYYMVIIIISVVLLLAMLGLH